MKKLVLGLFVATLASQTTGCIFVDDDDDDGGDVVNPGDEAVIRANWDFVLANDGAGNCGAADTVAVITSELDGSGNVIAGTELTDLYDCVDGTGVTDPLPPSQVLVYLEAQQTVGASLVTLGQTLSEVIDITNVNVSKDFEFIQNGGRIVADWVLVGETSGNDLTCAAAGAESVSILATLSGSTDATEDLFDCADQTGVTSPIATGAYTVSFDALNSADQALGTMALVEEIEVGEYNDLVEVSLELPIAGK